MTLKVFSNLPDRKNGQGLVEQIIIDDYMEENPNVTIEVEALDEEAYKTKFKAYSMEGMPDVVSIWGQPAFLDEVLDAGVLAELNQDDYKEYGFISGSLNGFMKDGKLYGLSRNTDVAGFYYNQKMFEDNGWEVPTTYDELLTLAGEIKDKDIVPLATDGGKGTATDIAAWNGGGYAVSADSEVKEEAVKFLNYMYQPDKLSKYGWENGVGMSAQDQSAYMTGDERERLQRKYQDRFTLEIQSEVGKGTTVILVVPYEEE